MKATIREYESADLGRLLDLWERLDAPLPGEPRIDEAVPDRVPRRPDCKGLNILAPDWCNGG